MNNASYEISGAVGVKSAEIHHRMLALYGNVNSVTQHEVYEWVKRF